MQQSRVSFERRTRSAKAQRRRACVAVRFGVLDGESIVAAVAVAVAVAVVVVVVAAAVVVGLISPSTHQYRLLFMKPPIFTRFTVLLTLN